MTWARLALTVGRGFDVVSQSWANPNAVVPPRRYAVMLVDPGAGSSRVLTTTVGGPPTLEWSPDGSRLLVCAPSHGPSTGCGNHYVDSSAGGFPPQPSVLSVVHVDSGRSRVVARGRLQFAGWSPTGDGYAWADDLDLHVVRANGASRRHTIDVSGGSWLGWSPDGKHIAAGPNDSYELIDVATGKTSWPIPPSYSRYIIQSVRWWP